MSGERGSSSGVSGDVLSWLPRLFSRKSSLGAESRCNICLQEFYSHQGPARESASL